MPGGLSQALLNISRTLPSAKARRGCDWQACVPSKGNSQLVILNETSKGGEGEAVDRFAKETEGVIPDHKEDVGACWVPGALSPHLGDSTALEVEYPHIGKRSAVPPPESHDKPFSDENG